MKLKMKTKRAAYKRFRKCTASGKIVRAKRNHGHFLSKMGHRKARKLQGTTYVSDSNFDVVNSLVPSLGAKRKRTLSLRRAAAVAKANRAAANAKQEG